VGRVRDFTRDDIPIVANLWLKVIYRRQTPAPPSLRDYFAEMFFRTPWSDPTFPSLVYEDDEACIVGFLGVLPRPMIFQKRLITAAVSTQFFVDASQRNSPAAFALMNRFLEGPQDLSFTDGATDVVRRIWQAFHGHVATLYCCAWTRVLRPLGYVSALAATKPTLRSIAAVSSPFGRVLDSAITHLPRTLYPAPRTTAIAEEATDEALLEWITHLASRYDLRSNYDLESFRWILHRTGDATRRGTLRKLLVRDVTGNAIGWYVYFANPDGIAKLVHIGGKERSITDVLNSLFHRAWCEGSVAVSGRADPRFLKELSDVRCDFTFHDLAVLVHSRDEAIVNAVHRGAAMLTRLDGEWWMRFHEEQWR
jgi:hypothetical protein